MYNNFKNRIMDQGFTKINSDDVYDDSIDKE
jgi:hypothetical protein